MYFWSLKKGLTPLLFGGGFLFYIFLMSLMKTSIWFLMFQNMMYSFFFLNLVLAVKSNKSFLMSFKKLVTGYLVVEVLVEILFLMSYLGGVVWGLSVLGVFKMGVFPFFYYKDLVYGLDFNYFYFSCVLGVYFVFSKVWALLMLVTFPYSYYNLFVLVFYFSFYFLLDLNYKLKDFIFKSFVFSNLLMLTMSSYMSWGMILFYMILSSYFQFKILMISNWEKKFFSEDFLMSIFHLTLLNGNLLWLFNFLKILVVMSLFEDLSMTLGILLSFISLVFLFFSFNIFMKDFLSLSFYSISKYIFTLHMSIFLLGIFSGECEYILALQVMGGLFMVGMDNSIEFFSELVESSELSSEFYFNFFLELGLGVFMMGLLLGMKNDFFLKGWGVTNPLCIKLQDLLSFLFFKLEKNSNKNLKGYYKLFIPTIMLILPLFGMFLSSNNSESLYSEGGMCSGGGYKSVFLNMMAFQWGWDLTIICVFPKYFMFKVYFLNLWDKGDLPAKSFSDLKELKKYSKQIFYIEEEIKEEGVGSSKSVFPLLEKSLVSIKSSSLDVLHAMSSMELGFKTDMDSGSLLEESLYIYKGCGSEFSFLCYEYCGDKHSQMSGGLVLVSDLDLEFLSSESF